MLQMGISSVLAGLHHILISLTEESYQDTDSRGLLLSRHWQYPPSLGAPTGGRRFFIFAKDFDGPLSQVFSQRKSAIFTPLGSRTSIA
jgi:hypothetical protein